MLNILHKYLKSMTALTVMLAAASCSGDEWTRYVVVRLPDHQEWSILDLKSGELLYKDRFSENPSAIVNDKFCIRNEHGLYDYYSISDIGHPLNSGSYRCATSFSQSDIALVVKPGEGISIIDGKCKVIATLGDDIARATRFRHGYSIITDKNDKKGFIDESGKIIVRPQYDEANEFTPDGIAIVGNYIGTHSGMYFAIDTNGEELFSFFSSEYYDFDDFFNGYLPVQARDDEAFLLDKTGEKFMSLGVWDAIGPAGPVDNAVVFCEDELYGLKNLQGEIIAPAQYQYLSPLTEVATRPYFLAMKDGRCGIIDSGNNHIVPFDYEILGPANDHIFAGVANGTVSFFDTSGKTIGSDYFADASFLYFTSVESDI